MTAEILFYPAIRLNSLENMSVTPSPPRVGGHTRGAFSGPLLRWNFHESSTGLSLCGGCPTRGGEGIRYRSPQEHSMIITDNFCEDKTPFSRRDKKIKKNETRHLI